MPRVSTQDPLQGYNFRLSISGLPNSCGFKKIGGLVQELSVVTYDEGGYDTTHRLKGRKKTGELVCEKGLFPNQDIENLFKNTLMNKDYRTTATVELLGTDGKVARKWTLSEVCCSKWEVGEFQASSEGVVAGTITLQYQDFI